MNLDQLILDFARDLPPEASILLIPNPGNGGDMLINAAIIQSLIRTGIPFTLQDPSTTTTKPRDSFVLYCPAGGLVSYYEVSRNIIERHLDAKKLLLLPCTIRGHEPLLKEMGSNVTVVARDEITYQHIIKYCTAGAKTLKCDDCALFLDIDDVMQMSFSYFRYILDGLNIAKWILRDRLIRMFRWEKVYLNGLIKSKLFSSTIYVIRSDSEKTIPAPLGNVDISSVLEGNPLTESEIRITAHRFLKFLSLYDNIHTNRLHAAIGGAILGKKVHLHDNAYGKNFAVASMSLIDRPEFNVELKNNRLGG